MWCFFADGTNTNINLGVQEHVNRVTEFEYIVDSSRNVAVKTQNRFLLDRLKYYDNKGLKNALASCWTEDFIR